MTNFLRWLTITSVLVVFYGVIEYNFKFFSNMAAVDDYYICYGLWGLLFFVVIEALLHTDSKGVHKLSTLSFVASLSGLLGTFLGMAGAFGAVDISSLDPSNITQIRTTMAEMFECMYLAMNTTITGIFVSLPALAYLYFIGANKNETS